MANISSQSTRTGGRAGTYATKDAVAVSALNATVPGFERRLQEIRRAHGKDGLRPRVEVDENGRLRRDENGSYVIAKDSRGNTVYESKYVEAYSLVQSFGHDELDPSDPESWTRANELGRAIVEDRFPGHPALIATEVNGRSGCVHNHLIVGAVHPETGKSIDSNVVTHSRLALAHDRVLAKHDFEQRADMQEMAQAAAEKVEKRRRAAEAEEGFGELSPSQQERRLVAAEKSVRIESQDEKSSQRKRGDRRQREYERYMLNEQEREVALEIGVTPEKERFSEIVLESRIRETLSDPRAQSWDDVVEVGRHNGVVIGRRGKDVTYGMLRATGDGELAEPGRNDTRRGDGLGDGYRLSDVETAIEENVEHQLSIEAQQAALKVEGARQQSDQAERIAKIIADREAQAAEMAQANDADLEALQDRLDGKSTSATAAESAALSPAPADEVPASGDAAETAVEQTAPQPAEPEPVPTPRFRSRLRDRRARDDRSRAKLDAIAQLEEDYHGQEPDAEFEERATKTHALGERFLKSHGDYLEPGFRAHIENRVAQTAERSSAFDERTALLEEQKRLTANRRPFDPAYDDAVAKNRRDLRFYDGYIERIETDRRQGEYGSRAHERDEHTANEKQIAKNHVAQRVADLEPADADAVKREARIAKAMGNLRGDRQTSRDRVRTREDDGLER